jgi:hypothetical protein
LVDPQDVAGVARTILDLLKRPTLSSEYAAKLAQVAADYRWEAVCQPLIRFCQAPYIAPDKSYLHEKSAAAGLYQPVPALWRKGVRALKIGGVKGLWQQIRQYVRWRVRKFQKL